MTTHIKADSTLPVEPLKPETAPAAAPRIVSLDQFRGYTVIGMFFVNFVGHFAVIPAIYKHHNTYCSYADTIMPQFLFAVGFAYRLTFLRRLETNGWMSALLHALKRSLGLILLGVVVYHLDGGVRVWDQVTDWWSRFGEMTPWQKVENVFTPFHRNPFQTLVHIGVTSLWVLPVIGARPLMLIFYLLLSALLHVAFSAGWITLPSENWVSYYQWEMKRPGIDGGPAGFLTWTIPLLIGSLAHDVFMARGPWRAAFHYLINGMVIMGLGYGLACLNTCTQPNKVESGDFVDYLVEPPFVKPPTLEDGKTLKRPPNMWTMSQRAGSVSYLFFGAGFSLFVFGLFVVLCDGIGLRIGLLHTFGANALAAYLIHDVVNGFVKPYSPKDSPLWFALSATGVFYLICYLFLRYLEKHKLYLRL